MHRDRREPETLNDQLWKGAWRKGAWLQRSFTLSSFLLETHSLPTLFRCYRAQLYLLCRASRALHSYFLLSSVPRPRCPRADTERSQHDFHRQRAKDESHYTDEDGRALPTDHAQNRIRKKQ